ncbi:hypothetical protein DSM106972_077390 [Dulcicalothrix desertica PCC 7102]|uniref:N-acetyltransferase domain-containing protein n=1 Tax=Dulcicalothrix desertica PCC 7102 TaxID=232991 RepID=A0A433UZQ2_9CYAN|nr:GNAT family N-acetyltransferase [Dulcicalothrix desertica]RUS99297.1 hypothetical protein DSM106972_077390 [Dulcicalothrix desertica PCC 7102]TWH49963.1 hypothetical protein CAL7102_04235 [Dulcicalothrix desertica PCC 7102]
MNDFIVNKFSYVIGADQATQNELISWITISLQYINRFFEGDRSRIRGTKFGDCVSKVEFLVDSVIDSDDASLFRGVRDESGRLQAGAIVSRQYGVIYPDIEQREYLSIDPFTTPPWNCLEGVAFPETIKGAATWLMADIIIEVIDTNIEGVTKLLTIDRARSFYESIGFQSNPDFDREMILTKEAAQLFVQNQLRIRGTAQ